MTPEDDPGGVRATPSFVGEVGSVPRKANW